MPIVFQTGQGNIAAGVQKDGADDFMEKPVPSTILREVIERALAHHIMEKLNVTSLAAMVSVAEKLGRIQLYSLAANLFPKGQYICPR
ncbi:hypothetical protein [Arvimicrobium flavum]|uniref:hypothetical protein n=1 Tax=Arvimicrobium flavum TaxID=3393320 RepID=UPI0030844991